MIRMQTHFPDAYYLHLTRHPCDMIKSLLQLQQTLRERILERTGMPGPALGPRVELRKAWKNTGWSQTS